MLNEKGEFNWRFNIHVDDINDSAARLFADQCLTPWH